MKKFFLISTGILISIWSTTSCSQEEVIPKPKAQLRLEYPTPQYEEVQLNHISFKKNKITTIEKISPQKFNLVYPKMKAKIYLTYYPVKNNLDSLLRDAEKFTFEHTIKADEIIRRDFLNPENKVFGSINLVTGNAASQIQFHATDSLKHFINGSLYFYAQPNYDSIMPAVHYIRGDIQKFLESLKWK
jgi:gliding motility-associated lipoprotein GldD